MKVEVRAPRWAPRCNRQCLGTSAHRSTWRREERREGGGEGAGGRREGGGGGPTHTWALAWRSSVRTPCPPGGRSGSAASTRRCPPTPGQWCHTTVGKLQDCHRFSGANCQRAFVPVKSVAHLVRRRLLTSMAWLQNSQPSWFWQMAWQSERLGMCVMCSIWFSCSSHRWGAGWGKARREEARREAGRKKTLV